MSWSPVAKPAPSDWMNLNPSGRTQYDQSNIPYDDAAIFYDGIDMFAWSDVLKPVNGKRIVPGMATGLVIPFTYSRSYDASPWTKVAKPTS